MGKIIKPAIPGLINSAEIFYEGGHPSFTAELFDPTVMTIAIQTIYGMLYATISEKLNYKELRTTIVHFETRSPDPRFPQKAPEKIKPAPLPKHVLWDISALVHTNSDPGEKFKMRVASDDHYPSKPNGQTGSFDEFIQTAKFSKKFLRQLTRELNDLGIITTGAIFSLLKFRQASNSFTTKKLRTMAHKDIDAMLGSLLVKGQEAEMLLHADKDIRTQAVAFLSQRHLSKSLAKPKTKAVKRTR